LKFVFKVASFLYRKINEYVT